MKASAKKQKMQRRTHRNFITEQQNKKKLDGINWRIEMREERVGKTKIQKTNETKSEFFEKINES